jgi:hypothetical protein
MKENLLEEWSSKMKEFVWRNGLISTSPFADIDKIKDNLLFFFSKKAFEYDHDLPKTDQMYSLIYTPRTSSLYKLAEIANTIAFYRTLPNFNVLDIHGKKRKLTYDELQGKIFELFINKVFINNGLHSDIRSTYTDSTNIDHPIDVTLNFRDTNYLIECYKVENQIKELFTKLIYQINKFASKFSNDFSQGELFSGYIVFKTEPLTSDMIHHTGIIFKDAINQFITGFRNKENREVKLDFQFENSFIEFKLFSNMLSESFNLNLIHKKPFNSLTFKTVLHGEIFGRITFDFAANYVYRNYLSQIEEKIQHKISQHRKSPIKKKIIVVEFENITDNKIYQGSIPVTKNDIGQLNFNKLIDNDTSILFWIKTIEPAKYMTSIGFAGHPTFDKALKSSLLNFKINWC